MKDDREMKSVERDVIVMSALLLPSIFASLLVTQSALKKEEKRGMAPNLF